MPEIRQAVSLITPAPYGDADSYEPAVLSLNKLAVYAGHLLNKEFNAFIQEGVKLLRSMDIPLMRFIGHLPEDQMVLASSKRTRQMLEALRDNKAGEYIEQSLKEWLSGNSIVISREQVVAEDVIVINRVRRKLFAGFIPAFTGDTRQALEIIDEFDQFTTELEKRALAAIFTMQFSLFNQTQSIARIGNWQWDLKNNKLSWSDEMYRIYGLMPGQPFHNSLASFNHPDDQRTVDDNMQRSRETGQPHDFYYRIILADGTEKLLHARGQVLCDESGEAITFFGTAQDVTESKKAEEIIRENQLFIYKMMELAPFVISVYNVHTGQYRYVSNSLQRIMGYDMDEVKAAGNGFFIPLVHPDDLENVIKKNAAAFMQANAVTSDDSGSKMIDATYRIKQKNGLYRWFNTCGTVFSRNAANQIQELITISLDVDELMQTSELLQEKLEELRASEERYHKMTSEVEDYAIVLLSPTGEIVNWNKGAEKIKGYSAVEVIGRHFSLFFTLEDQKNKVPDQSISEAAHEGRTRYEGWRVRKNGDRFWGSIVLTALFNDAHELIGFSKVTRDLTERKMAEIRAETYMADLEKSNVQLKATSEALRKALKTLAEDRTRFILESIPHLVATISAEGIFTYVNHHLLNYTGLTIEQFQTGEWFAMIHPDDRLAMESAWSESFEKRRVLHSELRLCRTDGSYEWHLGIAQPFLSPLENTLIWVLTFTNIHEQRQTAEKKDEFIGIASHELKTPLTSAKGFLQLAKKVIDEEQPGSVSSEYLVKAGNSLERLKNIVVELLDATRLQHGQFQLHPTRFKLDSLIKDIVEMMKVSLDRYKLHIGGDENVDVCADRDKIEQVLINLLTNAIKYSPESSQVDINVTATADLVTVSVKDQGLGISPRDLPHIFDKFFRVTQHHPHSPGMGLGLYISAEIIRSHGGRIWAESLPGSGSVFSFSLPVEDK